MPGAPNRLRVRRPSGRSVRCAIKYRYLDRDAANNGIRRKYFVKNRLLAFGPTCSKEHVHKGQGRQRLEPDLVPALLEPSWQLPTFPLQDTIRPHRLLGFRFNQASVMRETLLQLSSSGLRKERSLQAPLWCSWKASVTRDRVDARSVDRSASGEVADSW
jgi:hypothetical protein